MVKMLKNQYKRKINLLKSFIVLSFLFISITSLMVSSEKNNDINYEKTNSVFGDGYTDITVSEAYDLLTNLDNGLQIPIDVRTDSEWIGQRINTSYPEDPRHHCSCAWSDPSVVQEFIDQYQGEEIILYCRSGVRSVQAAEILVNNNFDGIIYNMLGGISQWESSGYPTNKGNTVPDIPNVLGPTECIIGNYYTYSAKARDPDFDAVRYGWDYDGDKSVDEWTDFNFSDTLQNTNILWDKIGSYTISVIAEDRVGDQSISWGSLIVSVISDDQTNPIVDIIKPSKYIYLNNKEVLPFFIPFIIGDIDITINSVDEQSGIDYVELYINNEKVGNSTEEEYIFNWDEKVFGRFTIKAIAYDKASNTAVDSIDIWKFF